jgi:CHAT domain-containing protein
VRLSARRVRNLLGWLGIALAGGGALSCRGADRRPSARGELIAALGPWRATEGRLTGGFAYAPLTAAARPLQRSDPALRRALQRIQSAGARHPSAQALGDLAIVELLAGQVERAVSLLEQAAASEPGNAPLLSDLAAAYLDRAGDGARPYDLVRALATVDQAVGIDPGLSEASFNRALALEKLALRISARSAWRELLARHQAPGWSAETRTHLRALAEPTAGELWQHQRPNLDAAALQGDHGTVRSALDRFPQEARQYAEEDLLAAWGEAEASRQEPSADRALRIARAIGEALVERGGDPMARDAVAAIDRARSESPARFACLVEGHAVYGSGLRHYLRRELDLAIPELTRAARAFACAGTPFGSWAEIYLASAGLYHADFARAQATLERLLSDPSAARYPAVSLRVLLLLGSLDLLRGRPGEAVVSLERGLALAERMREVENVANLHQLLGVGLSALGSEEAWPHLFQASRALRQVQSYRRTFAILDEMGIACQVNGQPAAALDFANESLSHALHWHDSEEIAEALLRRARALASMRLTARALEDLPAAEARAAQVTDPPLRERLQAEIRVLDGELTLAFDPPAAVQALTRALDFLRGSSYRLDLSLDLLLRARAHLASGDLQAASADYEAGLREIESIRGGFSDQRLRIAVLDQSTRLVDEILAFQASRANGGEVAFAVSERARARQLLEEVAAPPLPAARAPEARRERLLGTAEVRRRLPAGTAIVKYAVLADRLLIWGLGRTESRFQQVHVSAAEIEARVRQVRQEMQSRTDPLQLRRDLEQLHTWLVSPIEEILGAARDVIFVPDKGLHLLPFAALVDPRTGRYLVEERASAVAPSANVYIRILDRLRSAPTGSPVTALAIGDPRFDRQRFLSLPELPGAGREAALVAAAYPRGRLLTGSAATRTRFFAALTARPQILHFAGHSIANSDRPELSLLLFAGDPAKRDSGAVYSYEIQGRRWDGLDLVVLSACSTAVGRPSASEGMINLARPFLARGVPAVLASIADIDDRRTPDLLVRFHRRLRAGSSPIAALWEAQRALLAAGSGSSSPADWALFQLIGGSLPNLER